MGEEYSDTLLDRVERAARGDAESWRQLIAQHYDHLRRMVAIRLDPRLQGRVDPSDVLQETYLEAARQLDDYLRNPTLPFFLWLRLLAAHRLGRAHRFHLGARQRDAGREAPLEGQAGSDISSQVLAACLLGRVERPSEQAARHELHERLQAMLERLSAADREVLALRHFEQLSTAETAQVLGISPAAAGKRYVRAMGRLRVLLAEEPDILEGWQS